MAFDVPADAYDRLMGRYSALLAPQLADFAGVRRGQRALDVGCGPGALTAELVGRMGLDAVAAVDPSPSFVAAARERRPEVDVRQATAEDLPFGEGEFDVALAQLVVHFMSDPVAGLREMARVTRAGGTVAACVWDHAGDQTPIAPFWRAVRDQDPGARDESDLAGAREGHLAALCREAGLRSVEEGVLPVALDYEGFEEWWEPLTFGIGPAGTYLAALDDAGRAELRERCRRLLGDGPFTVTGRAWAARGVS